MPLTKLSLATAARSLSTMPDVVAVVVDEDGGDERSAIITAPAQRPGREGSSASAERDGAVGVAVYLATPRHERLTIGRRSHNDIVVSDIRVSGEHATLARGQGGFWLADNGSSNGTTWQNRLLARGETGRVFVPFGGTFAVADVRVVLLDAARLAMLAASRRT